MPLTFGPSNSHATMMIRAISLALILLYNPQIEAWMANQPWRKATLDRSLPRCSASSSDDDNPTRESLSSPRNNCLMTRRSLSQLFILSTSAVFILPSPSFALVKGNAPPSKKSKDDDTASSGNKPKCTNVEECQARAEQQADLERKEALEKSTPALVTKGGTRYRDFELGNMESPAVKDGSQVEIFYKVLKLGKRSYDGLSGEGTVVFSRGYGLEDDEEKEGVKTFATTVGSLSNVQALNEALIGMHLGGMRRFAVLPEKGWRKPGNLCDGGPGGKGQGGELKTDYMVVPTATMVAQEACFDQSKQPFPTAYAEQRRMAQRFDQSVIMEVKVVSIS